MEPSDVFDESGTFHWHRLTPAFADYVKSRATPGLALVGEDHDHDRWLEEIHGVQVERMLAGGGDQRDPPPGGCYHCQD